MTIMSQNWSRLVPLERAVVRVDAWREDDDLDWLEKAERDNPDCPGGFEARMSSEDLDKRLHWNVMAEVGVDRTLLLGEYDSEDEANAALGEVYVAAMLEKPACVMPKRGFLNGARKGGLNEESFHERIEAELARIRAQDGFAEELYEWAAREKKGKRGR